MTIYKIRGVCPDMKAQVDMEQIREVLSDSPGFNTVHFNLAEHQIEFITANQDGGRDAIHKLSRAGYPVSEFEVEGMGALVTERTDTSVIP